MTLNRTLTSDEVKTLKLSRQLHDRQVGSLWIKAKLFCQVCAEETTPHGCQECCVVICASCCTKVLSGPRPKCPYCRKSWLFINRIQEEVEEIFTDDIINNSVA